MKNYYVYVIESKEHLHYTGVTEDLEFRLNQHNSKSLSFWTKRGSNWKVVYKKCFDNKTEALKYEKWLKSGAGRDFLKRTIGSQN